MKLKCHDSLVVIPNWAVKTVPHPNNRTLAKEWGAPRNEVSSCDIWACNLQIEYLNFIYFRFQSFFRNVLLHLKKLGTLNIFSVPSVENNLGKKDSMSGMANHTVGMIILICLHQNVVAVTGQLWRIIYLLWTVSGMLIALFAG